MAAQVCTCIARCNACICGSLPSVQKTDDIAVKLDENYWWFAHNLPSNQVWWRSTGRAGSWNVLQPKSR